MFAVVIHNDNVEAKVTQQGTVSENYTLQQWFFCEKCRLLLHFSDHLALANVLVFLIFLHEYNVAINRDYVRVSLTSAVESP